MRRAVPCSPNRPDKITVDDLDTALLSSPMATGLGYDDIQPLQILRLSDDAKQMLVDVLSAGGLKPCPLT